MILYLDTSALAKLYLEEEASDQVRVWADEAEVLATSRLALAELAAAVARRHREGDLTEADVERVRTAMLDDWKHLIVIELNEHRAADLAFRQSLRGFDAIHLAAALEIRVLAAVRNRGILVVGSALLVNKLRGIMRASTAGRAAQPLEGLGLEVQAEKSGLRRSADAATGCRAHGARRGGPESRSTSTLLRHLGAGAGLAMPLPVPRLAVSMEPPAALCGLVPAVGGSLVLTACSLGTGRVAVPLPAVTPGAQEDRDTAAVADEPPLGLHLAN